MSSLASRSRVVWAVGVVGISLAACKGKDDRVVDTATGAVVGPDSAARAAAPGGPTKADASMQPVLDQLGSLGGKPIETLTPAEARQQPTPKDAVMAMLVKQGKDTTPAALVPGVTSVDRTVRGAAGSIPARIYTPEGAGPFPVVVYYHGGGWVIADKNVYDGGARGLAKAANAVVVSIDYRRAPENKFPAAHQDALAAYRWALTNAASIKGDPKRVALAGESAGGNLAVATAVAARDAKLQTPSAVISVYPIAQPDTTTASYNENANAKPLSRPMMTWFAKQTVRTPADLQDPRINLVKANLTGLPPVTIINAQIDPLRDDGKMLEDALRAANVPVERKLYDGVTHEFFGMAAVVDKAKDAQQYAGDRLKAAFNR
ncbi:MAG TPA: alpha/beta hydrolase [Gemmatimonadaceae bacterium]|nr:alpha/beta hydrolase [Gemmatimonadaceae bacterium]